LFGEPMLLTMEAAFQPLTLLVELLLRTTVAYSVPRPYL